jgi:hypothetical protein
MILSFTGQYISFIVEIIKLTAFTFANFCAVQEMFFPDCIQKSI